MSPFDLFIDEVVAMKAGERKTFERVYQKVYAIEYLFNAGEALYGIAKIIGKTDTTITIERL